MSSKYLDLSHEIESGMETYRGLPAPVISDHLTREASREIYAPGTEFAIAKIEMVANTGTYLDSPFHRFENGVDLAGLPLERLANLPGVLFRAPAGSRAISSTLFEGRELRGTAVLIHTGWDLKWRTEEYFHEHPYLTKNAVEHLAKSGAALVGIDSLNIDDTADMTRPAHTVLLEAGIPIVEHLCNLSLLPDSKFRFFATPPKVRRFGTFPVRDFAIVE
jgi:kynurenine formamidase